jgi:hypothetical protein
LHFARAPVETECELVNVFLHMLPAHVMINAMIAALKQRPNLCAFVHSDPASTASALQMSPVSVTYTAIMAQIIGVLCFFIALGKEKDSDLINLKKRFIAFDVNEKILPKKDLPLD